MTERLPPTGPFVVRLNAHGRLSPRELINAEMLFVCAFEQMARGIDAGITFDCQSGPSLTEDLMHRLKSEGTRVRRLLAIAPDSDFVITIGTIAIVVRKRP